MVELAEGLLRYLALVAWNEYCLQRGSTPDRGLEDFVSQNGTKWSFGDWRRLLQGANKSSTRSILDFKLGSEMESPTAAALFPKAWACFERAQSYRIPAPSLQSFLEDELGKVQVGKFKWWDFWTMAVEARNRLHGHSKNPGDIRERAKRILTPILLTALVEILDLSVIRKVMVDFPMATPEENARIWVEGEHYLVRYRLANFHGQLRKLTLRSPVDEKPPTIHGYLIRASDNTRYIPFEFDNWPRIPDWDAMDSGLQSSAPAEPDPLHAKALARYEERYRQYCIDEGKLTEKEAEALADLAELAGLAQAEVDEIHAKVEAEPGLRDAQVEARRGELELYETRYRQYCIDDGQLTEKERQALQDLVDLAGLTDGDVAEIQARVHSDLHQPAEADEVRRTPQATTRRLAYLLSLITHLQSDSVESPEQVEVLISAWLTDTGSRLGIERSLVRRDLVLQNGYSGAGAQTRLATDLHAALQGRPDALWGTLSPADREVVEPTLSSADPADAEVSSLSQDPSSEAEHESELERTARTLADSALAVSGNVTKGAGALLSSIGRLMTSEPNDELEWPENGQLFLKRVREISADRLAFEPIDATDDEDLDEVENNDGSLWFKATARHTIDVWFTSKWGSYVRIVLGFYSERKSKDPEYRAGREAMEEDLDGEALPGGWTLDCAKWKKLAFEGNRRIKMEEFGNEQLLAETVEALVALSGLVATHLDGVELRETSSQDD